MEGSGRGASAPGKLMLAGEYAVLGGAPAVVTAVSARAQATWSAPGGDGSRAADDGSGKSRPPGPEALLARRCAERLCGAVPMDLDIDVSALRSTDRKLGLGSSAASAAAAVGAVYAYHDRDCTSEAARREILDLALEGHHAVAPEGSGADVAAAVLGGTLRFRKAPGEVEAEPLTWPEGLALRVVWTGKAARTSDMVAKVNGLPATERQARLDAIGDAAASFISAFTAGDPGEVLAAVRAHHRGMAELGEAAGTPIVEERLSAVAEIVDAHGGAAKPSGAGGGDVALAFFDKGVPGSQFVSACIRRGFQVLSLTPGADGVLAISNGANPGDSPPS